MDKIVTRPFIFEMIRDRQLNSVTETKYSK